MFLRSKSETSAPISALPASGAREMTDPIRPSPIKRFLAGLRRGTPSAPLPRPEAPRPLIHDLNHVLGVVIGCFDEQIEQLSAAGELDREKLKKLAEEGLQAALRGAALTRRRPDSSDP